MNRALRRWTSFSRSVGETIDQFFALRWWWRWQQRRSEAHLEFVLEQYSERSFEARRATRGVQELDFAVRYWRTATPEVQRVVERAADAGVPVEDLRLLVLNRDLIAEDGHVSVRHSRLVNLMTMVAGPLICGHWLLMVALIILQNADWAKKLIVTLAVTGVYAALYRGWSLYMGRPQAAAYRSEAQLNEIVVSARVEEVVLADGSVRMRGRA